MFVPKSSVTWWSKSVCRRLFQTRFLEVFWLQVYWSWSTRIQLIRLCDGLGPNRCHYRRQWWPNSLTHMRVKASTWVQSSVHYARYNAYANVSCLHLHCLFKQETQTVYERSFQVFFHACYIVMWYYLVRYDMISCHMPLCHITLHHVLYYYISPHATLEHTILSHNFSLWFVLNHIIHRNISSVIRFWFTFRKWEWQCETRFVTNAFETTWNVCF